MYRSLIVGGLAFAVTMLAKSQLAAVGSDIARYNRIRAMSNDPPLLNQSISMLRDIVKKFAVSRRRSANTMLDSLIYDASRYARISRM